MPWVALHNSLTRLLRRQGRPSSHDVDSIAATAPATVLATVRPRPTAPLHLIGPLSSARARRPISGALQGSAAQRQRLRPCQRLARRNVTVAFAVPVAPAVSRATSVAWARSTSCELASSARPCETKCSISVFDCPPALVNAPLASVRTAFFLCVPALTAVSVRNVTVPVQLVSPVNAPLLLTVITVLDSFAS